MFMKTITLSIRIVILALFVLFAKQSKAQCAANFTWSVNSNGNVTYTSTSTLANSVTTVYYWTFGNGIPTYTATGSAGMFPTYNYTANGNYTVSLFILSTTPSCSTAIVYTVSVNTVTCSLQANFSIVQGSNGLVNFVNTSSGTFTGTSYSWNFGNGNNSAVMSPSTTYSANGVYIATLTANNNFTPSCISTKTANVFVNSVCNLISGYTYALGNNGLVTFSNTTTNASSVSAASYSWNFGNSVVSTATNPSLTYTANGVYSVILSSSTATPACTSSFSNVIVVNNVGCGLSANFSYSQAPNGVVNFSNITTGTTSSTSYTWNFGDNSTSNSTSPAHTYSANGAYIVSLSAQLSTSNNCVSTFSTQVNVSSFCSWASSFTVIPGAGSMYLFLNTSTGTISSNSYTWNLGNGQIYTGTGNGGNILNSFSTGVYSISLSLSSPSNSNCISVSNTVIVINTPTCALNPSFYSSQGTNGSYTFVNTSVGMGNNTTYTINYGDGFIANSFNPLHTYTANGVYTVSLLASNNSTPACIMSAFQIITVNSVCSLVANFNYNLNSNGNVVFINTTTPTVSVISGSLSVFNTYTWNFGNGQTSNSFSPSTNYSANGVYVVTLSVLNTQPLCSSTKTLALSITSASCLLTASFIPVSYTNNVMTFTNVTSGNNANSTYTWNFNNGITSNQFNPPPQSYTANGVYTTSLSVNNGTVCTSSFSRVDTICSFVPSISFTQGFNGNVTFSTNAQGANYLTTYWQFMSPNSTYNTSYNTVVTRTLSNGVYTPTLIVDYGAGCTKTVNTVLTVTDNPCGLAAAFTHTISSNGLVNFTDNSIGTTTSSIYYWDFGDGWFTNNVNPNHTDMNGGVHYVSLSIVDTSNGYCTSSATMALNITGITCQANANFSVVPTNTAQYWNAYLAYPYNITGALWTWGDGNSDTTLYASHQYSAAANYSICLSVTASCGSTATSCYTYNIYKGTEGASNIIFIDVMPGQPQLETGIEQMTKTESFNVYPNPNKGEFMLDISALNGRGNRMVIMDLMGKIILDENIGTGQSEVPIRLNMGEIHTGMYFLKVFAGENTYTRKLIVQP